MESLNIDEAFIDSYFSDNSQIEEMKKESSALVMHLKDISSTDYEN